MKHESFVNFNSGRVGRVGSFPGNFPSKSRCKQLVNECLSG